MKTIPAPTTAIDPAVLHLPVVPDKPRGMRLAAAPAGKARVLRVVSRHSVGNGSCVAYARSQGFKISGIARNVPTLAKKNGYEVNTTPEVGALIVTRESSAGTNSGHVTGRIKEIDDGFALVTEQNYRSGIVTEGWVPLIKAVAFIHPQS